MQKNGHLQAEVETLIKEFRAVAKNARRGTLATLTTSAKPFVAALFIAAPHGRKIHKRYGTTKLIRGRRARRGSGQVVATYYPGNLAASFQVMRFRNANYTIHVGAKLAKGAAQGTFGPSFGRTDGYYAHMVEKGTRQTPAQPFVAPTWERMREPVKRAIVAGLQKKLKRIKA